MLRVLTSPRPVPYRQALLRQEELHRERVEGRREDTLWLLEHPPVITLGLRKNQEKNILADPAALGVELVSTNRGGLVTYHGPGQLVGYFFAHMEGWGGRVRCFVEKIETILGSYLSQEHGIETQKDGKNMGVWIHQDKIAAIGMSIRERVTMHGFALNIQPDLSHFQWIVPCGLSRRGVTSLEKITGKRHSMETVTAQVGEYFRQEFRP